MLFQVEVQQIEKKRKEQDFGEFRSAALASQNSTTPLQYYIDANSCGGRGYFVS